MITCKIISPKNSYEYKGLKSIDIPVPSGRLQILPHHAESFFSLTDDEVILEKKEGGERIKVKDAECHVKGDNVTIILKEIHRL